MQGCYEQHVWSVNKQHSSRTQQIDNPGVPHKNQKIISSERTRVTLPAHVHPHPAERSPGLRASPLAAVPVAASAARTLPPAASALAAVSGSSPDSRHSMASRRSPPQRASSARQAASVAPEASIKMKICRWRSFSFVPDSETMRLE